jgi:hypothetical protein
MSLGFGQSEDGSFPPLDGWKFSADEKVYTPDNLWDVIDGAADLFLEYGFVDLHIGRYQQGEENEIKVEIYKHDSPEDAFGMYSQERNPKHAFLDIGVQAYREEGVLNFLTGVYYVKIMTHQRGASAIDVMTSIAKGLNTQLKQQNKFPDILTLLPTEGKIPNSEQYIAKSFLGYAFLHSAYVAQYGDKSAYRVFVIQADLPTDALSMFDSYRKAAPGGTLEAKDGQRYTIRDRFNGLIKLVVKANFVAGIVNYGDEERADKSLGDVEERIHKFVNRDKTSH